MSAVQAVVRRSLIPRIIVFVCVGLMALIAGLFIAARYGVLLPQARVMLEARADGLKIGRLGQLKIQGLEGDVWRDFTVRRLTIRDEKGVWLEASDVHMRWRYAELLRRRFVADSIESRSLRLLRRPTLSAKTKDRGLPVSFRIDKARARIEMLPEFSYQRGVYDLDLSLNIARRGGRRGHVRASSVLHPGDHLNLDFDLSRRRPLLIAADAVEAQGGAMAGALGLSPTRPFVMRINARGRNSRGRFTALATSGSAVVLRAQGDWTPDGGRASGDASLAASRLTAPFARRLGPQATFTLSGRREGPQFSRLDGRVATQNFAVTARGLGDLGQRRIAPEGLQLEAQTSSLSRLLGGPAEGPARMAGTLKQAGRGWRFAGSATATRLAAGGYGLAQATGPVEATYSDRSVRIKARLVGAGGRGQGWLAAAMGGAPRADMEATRLSDGRILLNRLQVDGQGLKLQASGARGLLGGLTFRGRADLSNLAAARPGAAGAFSATWNASQSGAGKPWTFGVDGLGERFATGYAELDRLLGPRPRLAAQANYGEGRFAISKAEVTGQAARAGVAGTLAANGPVTLRLDWNARGPFRAGPVEIVGAARGSGAVTGTLGAPRADLIADLEQVDFPRLPLRQAHLVLSFVRRADGGSGMIAATADSAYGPARGRAVFAFPRDGLDLTDLSVDAGGLKASGMLSLRRTGASAADLQVVATRGAFLDAGRIEGSVRIVDAPAGPRATLGLTAENARLPESDIMLRAVRFRADGPLSRLPYSLEGDGNAGLGRWRLEGRGDFTRGAPGDVVRFEGVGRLGGRDLRTAEPAVIRLGGAQKAARLRLLAAGDGKVNLDGVIGPGGAEIGVELKGVGLNLLDEDMAGEIDATFTAQGRGPRLGGRMQATLKGARARGAPVAEGLDGAVSGTLADNLISLTGSATNSQGMQASLSLSLPAETSAAPFRIAIARQKPLQGRFAAEGEVRPLWNLLVGGERSLSGRVRAQGTIGGTLGKPNPVGEIAVQDGRFDDAPTGLSLRQVKLAASFAQSAVDVTQLSAVDGRNGFVTGFGRISLAPDGSSSFTLKFNDFKLIDNEQATASATGPATIDRAADGKVRISGDLLITRADVSPIVPAPSGVTPMDVTEVNRPPELAPEAAPMAMAGGWTLDVNLKAPRRVFLRGRGLDLEFSLDAHVGGTTDRPELTGTARVVRGDYDFANKRFQFDPSSVVYLSSRAQNIRLELTAVREDPTLTALVRIRGTAAKPDVTLSSSPSLPNDEVLSQVLFGRSASQLSPLEAAQLASALSSLAGGGGLDVIGNLRSFARLDRLALGGDAAAGVTVSGGKYLNDNVYLEITGGGRAGPSAEVEWRIKRSLSIISQLGGQITNQNTVQNGGRLSIRWRRDY